MARSAGNSLAVLRSVLASDASLLLFIAIDLGAGRQVRLVRDTRHWTAAGSVWQRAEILAEFPAESADGGVDSVTLKLGNL
ncbi:MAG: hypothetical protein LW822_11215, partial [Phycisphaeraceae bacterium]|nr:hypothetical protein [Phycisphaeraceae bacterium]